MEAISKRSNLNQYLIIALGTLIMGVAINVVFEPMDLVTGGLSGISIVVKYWTEPYIDGGIPLWLTNLVANIPIFVVAIILKGRKFIMRTLYSTICFTIALYIVPTYDVVYEDLVLASIFGGILMGAGLGLVFANNGSTGGTDLLGYIFQVKFKHISVPRLLLFIDGTIVALGAVVFGVNKALYAIIAVYITSKIMDSILEGMKFAKLAYVISDAYDEIAKEVLHTINRGATGIPAKGMYSNNEKKMLLCVVTKKEIVNLVDIVAQIDPKAFVIVSDVREVLGEGFIEYRQ